jgi:hypothetical protein
VRLYSLSARFLLVTARYFCISCSLPKAFCFIASFLPALTLLTYFYPPLIAFNPFVSFSAPPFLGLFPSASAFGRFLNFVLL